MTGRPARPLPASLWRDPVHWLAFGFGSGALPLAPGTWGTLAAVPLYLVLARLPAPWYGVAVAAMFLAGIWICGRTARDLGVHDHPGIVWDEIVGYLIAMAAAGVGAIEMIAGFLLFRLFDVVKPWPIRVADRHVGGGFGIMFDDALAGFYAMACLWAGQRLMSNWAQHWPAFS